LTGGT